jgi:hypothetical protein
MVLASLVDAEKLRRGAAEDRDLVVVAETRGRHDVILFVPPQAVEF